ncbi:TPA: TrbM/KikA/MpfK family conjugal transfer protein [Pseudomonas aeruginosa]
MRLKVAFLTAAIILSSSVQADQLPGNFNYGSESDSDACGATLCLLGMTRDGDCDKYVREYFSIVRYKKGKFSPSRTSEARGDFLAQCVEDQTSAGQANDKWGGSLNGF